MSHFVTSDVLPVVTKDQNMKKLIKVVSGQRNRTEAVHTSLQRHEAQLAMAQKQCSWSCHISVYV